MPKKSKHQIALEERIIELQAREREWLEKAAEWKERATECERIATEANATWGELQDILDSVEEGEGPKPADDPHDWGTDSFRCLRCGTTRDDAPDQPCLAEDAKGEE